MRLLLPKPRRDWRRWREGLITTGVELGLVDPWSFELFAESPGRRALWLNLDLYQGVICVSAPAARVLTDVLDAYWPMPPVGVLWVCNGPGTASILSTAGLDPIFPTRIHTAEAVLALPELQNPEGQKWLVVKGEGGRNFFAEALTERGAVVTEADVYRRKLDSDGLQQLVDESASADAILISSLTLAEGMLAAAKSHWRQWPGLWLVSSERIADWARAQGLRRVQQTDGASLASVHDALLKIKP